MTRDEYVEFLKENGYTIVITHSDNRWVGIMPQLFNVTMHEGKMFDMTGHDRRWCYTSWDLAVTALNEWTLAEFEGKPNGWIREPYTGLRRPDADETKEYYAP